MKINSGVEFGSRRIVSRAELLATGMRPAAITAAVRSHSLLRVRRDHYALPGTDRHTLEAVRVGGRLGCVSAAAELGIFAFDTEFTHLHVSRDASRLRSPRSRAIPLNAAPRGGVELHWWPLLDQADGTEYCVGARDALAQIIRCQPHNFALAALDTALHEGAITHGDLPEIFAHVPGMYRVLGSQVDARSEAGQETVLRRLVVDAGLECEIQVPIPGVGRVDLLVEKCVVVEADSRQYHSSWEERVRDINRDRLLAERGYLTLRVLYQTIMFEPDAVIRAIRELVLVSRQGSRHA
jgi:very-short-patch-repair endonuclease